MKSLETRTDQDNAILGQNFSIFAKLEKFVMTSYAGAIFPCPEKTIRPKRCRNGSRKGVSPNINRNGPREGVRPDNDKKWAS